MFQREIPVAALTAGSADKRAARDYFAAVERLSEEILRLPKPLVENNRTAALARFLIAAEINRGRFEGSMTQIPNIYDGQPGIAPLAAKEFCKLLGDLHAGTPLDEPFSRFNPPIEAAEVLGRMEGFGPDGYPVGELVEAELRRAAGKFTASPKEETAEAAWHLLKLIGEGG